jgi:uncharacterized protein (TIGR00255 family)
LPERLAGMESQIERILRQYVSRGTVQVNLFLDELTGETGYIVDEAALRVYCERLGILRERLRLPGEVTLATLLNMPGALKKTPEGQDAPPELREMTERALRQACDDMVRMRSDEGAFLWKEIVRRTRIVEDLLCRVEARVPLMLDEYRRRLTQRLSQLLENHIEGLRPEEVHREVALFTDRSDISEEIHRMRSHVAQLCESPDDGEPVGRKLEFIIQEMFRESNTMGSKANDTQMIHDIVAIKNEIEKLREQAFNVE